MNYVVKQGDTISKVALAFQIRPFDLLLNNPTILNEKTYLRPGLQLKIPPLQMNEYDPFHFETEYGPSDLEKDVLKLQDLGVKAKECGRSVMGKSLYQFEIGTGEKQVFYSGGWHANEAHTSKFLIRFLFTLAEANKKKRSLYNYSVMKMLKEVTLTVVPMVNPDGIELVEQGIYEEHPYYKMINEINKGQKRFEHWSSNIRGVDLNHQWPAGWEIEAKESPQKPWSRHYSGIAPLTEPEAIAVYELTMQKEFAYVLAFHSQGQVIYWGYRGYEPPESEQMVEKLSLASSYTPIHTADSDGGYKDWFILEKRRPGFTIEVGNGMNPLPNDAFAEIWSNNILLALEGLTL
ncbi:M14 family metallopeptidase [Alkalihalobacillus sp. 1P02AB]|uniref:M14 family metallopeptidase n=1 Tax=Alkalihalobacillus sp. 1P02AB TaxID=3132260 RepID=UPI0039A6068C